MSDHGHSESAAPGDHKVALAIAWTVVGVPLLYGISQTLIRVSQLFTG